MYESKMRTILGLALLATSLNCAAQKVTQYGEWKADTTLDGFQFATTTNPGGAVAGIVCVLERDGCEAFLNTQTTCENGGSYPLMINSSVGAMTITTKCTHLGSSQLLVADNFDTMISAYESGGEVGFAVPMANGQFRVFRFSTSGATPALRDARTRSPKTPSSKSKPTRQTKAYEAL